MASKQSWRSPGPTAPYATRAQSWSSSTSSAYGEAVKGRQDLQRAHKKDLDDCFNYVRWYGEKPGAPKEDSQQQESKVQLVSSPAKHSASTFLAMSAQDSSDGLLQKNIGYGSGLYAHASRGKPAGSQRTWSFERMPSLLPSPLLRGQVSCGVAPPDSEPQWPQCQAISRGPDGPQPPPLPPATPPTPGSAVDSAGRIALYRGTQQSLARSGSEPQVRIKGLQGVIGITWDNARRAAGDRYSGSSGEFLGF
eukprot:TRINITY_DN90952_c0_g1_i1.p1 TRINITY_DN90952_c0_g1~~TRINITY_DN90952_c0_g1_i1.p1  ORF type:complete len:251 (+),score=38.06 TRINITY_DN90952_c0_g1_i1:44-796(+)